MEKVITFKNSNENRLFGIVHIPDDNLNNPKRAGIIILNPGIKYRVAPNRLNVKIARQLCDEGYHVFRFDPEGIGDSEGAFCPNEALAEIAEKIQRGILVSDTVQACDFFLRTFKLTSLILIGNCGGAITALLSSERDTRIVKLILIDLPIQYKSSDYTFADKVVAGGSLSTHLFYLYLLKLFSPKAWVRFLMFKTDYRALLKIIKNKIVGVISVSHANGKLTDDFSSYCHDNGLNLLLFNAIQAFLKKKNEILFVLAGNDKSTEFFTKFCWDGYLTKNQELVNQTEAHLIENANHIYTLSEWQQSLINKVTAWVKKK